MPADTSDVMARRLGISREKVPGICELLDAGLHPVFIAHYRKSACGAMDDPTIRRLAEARRELAALEDLRQRARRLAEEAGALTDDLARAIAEAAEPEVLDDLIHLHRPKRRTAAVVAQERGLRPLADYIRAGAADGPDLSVKAAEFVNPEKEVRSPDEALAGASHILAEQIADDFRVRQAVRRVVWDKGILKSQQAKATGKQAAEFRGYFQFQEAINRLPPHRILAVNRGERCKALKVTIEVPPEAIKEQAVALVVPAGHRFAAFLEAAANDALARLVLPIIDREIRRQLTDRSDAHAIEVFAANLRSLLMARPVRGKRILAIQPGYRTGCKAAVLDRDGTLLGETILYPLEPQKKWPESKAAVITEVQRHGVELVAIGNGTGCREIEQLISETIEENNLDIQYAIISEAGAAVYADSDLGKQEFPNLDAAIRATISIGRRVQDPLAELVKVDPRAIGVGLYQHDVNQQRLRQALEETVESCVAAVGADAGTATPAMLRRIPGLSPAAVQSLCDRRAQAPLASREELKTLPNWDEKTVAAAVGFLRIRGANPLDATRVHLESYAAAERVLVHFGHRPEDLASSESAAAIRKCMTGVSLEPLAEELQIPLPELIDIISALQSPDFDPRGQHHPPVFRRKMRRIEDLTPGMWVKGTVRNVVDFGAFIDIGLKEDGLIHISQFSRRYVRNPLKFLHVGDVVDVRIVSVETDKHRIALTLIPENPPPKRAESRPPRRQAPARAQAGAAQTAEAGAAAQTDAAAAPGEAAPARRQGAGRRPPSAAEGDHQPPREGQRTTRRPEPRKRPEAAAGGRNERPAGRRPDRSSGDRRPPRTGPPRIIVSKSTPAEDSRPADEKGRPMIRWAYYDSDPQDKTLLPDETDDAATQDTPVAEPEAAEPVAAEVADPQVAAEPPAIAETPAAEMAEPPAVVDPPAAADPPAPEPPAPPAASPDVQPPPGPVA